ncbi:E3 ubiquitin-protein ligase ZNRF1 [Cylas formicarius]|uniref:E3 ubiquitin-protein ligase ZNRF1 n=1 Tax=Cylas formicarius TaxID=197179 RepID=UPI002958C73E|nr:E3 ubiquitin-protein ligase ZNRF1 [Cylas formicarius]XP_060535904.1 E3 ubiquitin-protein ligase ZNRF1 [Cylas formicarius]
MGAKPSTANGGSQSPRSRAFSTSSSSEVVTAPGFRFMRSLGLENDRQRARSLSSVPDLHGNGGPHEEGVAAIEGDVSATGSPGADTDSSGVGDETGIGQGGLLGTAAAAALGRVYAAHSLPGHIWSLNGIKCPVCSKFVVPDDIECHLVMCLTKPRLSYNEDVLTDDKGECVICLDDLSQGDVIARLPCLCIYHKACIDQWFEVNRSCPEHPGD